MYTFQKLECPPKYFGRTNLEMFWPKNHNQWATLGPLPGVWKFGKSLYRGQSTKLSQTYGVTYQNLCEKGTKPMEKELAQSDLPVWRKIQKTTQNVTFLKKLHFWDVFGIFLQTGKSDWANSFSIVSVPLSALVLIGHSIGLRKNWLLTPVRGLSQV